MSDPGKAVFLSYASQDAEAAKRICESLRAAGVEVWFDQSELVGGDQWDAKIRGQIGSCALFVPVISAATQARLEGYFRREWKQAAARTQDMADEKTFLLPIVIDNTRDVEAKVPAEFKAVQWTRLPGGAASEKFCERVKRLLGGSELEAGRPRPAERGEGAASPKMKRRPWLIPAIVGVVAVAVVAAWFALRPSSPPASQLPPPAAPAAVSEARQLIAKAWVLLNKTSLAREELGAADDLCRRAADLDPNDAEVWAAWSQVDSWYVYHRLERTAARQDGARAKAVRALNLAPSSYEARLAQACYLVREGGGQHVVYDLDEAEKLLQTLLRENPDEPRALEALGVLFRNTKKVTEYRDAFVRMAKTPAFAAKAYTELGWAEFFNGHNGEAEAAADAAIGLQPYYGNLNLKANILAFWWGDLPQAQATLDRLPAANRLEDYAISTQLETKYAQRDPDALLRVLDRFSRDWIESNAYDGPKAWWSGLAHRLAGRDEAGQLQWRTALKLVERRLVDQPDSSHLLRWRARLLAATGQPAEGGAVLRLVREMGHRDWFAYEATDEILLGRFDAAVAILEQRVEAREHMLTAASLRLGPDFDPLRSHPRFQALLARLEADPRFSPKAKPAPAAAVPTADKSIAVLAFKNLSGDPAREFFSDGLSEAVTDVLGRVPGLKVVGSASAFSFKGKSVSIPEIARQLGVTHLVEGTVLQEGQTVRITAKLIQADGFQMWVSDKLDRELKNIFALHDEVAGLIAKNLSLKLGATTAASKAPVNPEAFELYLQGRQAWNRHTSAGYNDAEKAFTRALALEPNFARAHAALADVWAQRHRRSRAADDQSRAVESARIRAKIAHALTLDPTSVEAHTSLGMLLFFDRQYAEAEVALGQAVALNPNDASPHMWLGRLFHLSAKMDEALVHSKLATELDPLTWTTWDFYGQTLCSAGQPTKGLNALDRSLGLRPDFGFTVACKSFALLDLGRVAEAVALVRGISSGAEGAKLRVFARAGLKDEAEALLATILPSDRWWAGSLVALGRIEEVMTLLTPKSISGDVTGPLWDPIYDPVRNDPRWLKVMADAGLTEAHARAQAWRKANPPEKPEAKP